MIRVAIVGATGYTGAELLDIALRHPEMDIRSLTAKVDEPVFIREEFPRFSGRIDMRCAPLDVEEVCGSSDCVFLALPHGISMKFAPSFIAAGKNIIDLSADFRFRDPSVYEEWYGRHHEAPGLLADAVYGLPELHRKEIEKAGLVANPGCFPTGAVLALAPLYKEELIDPAGVIIDAKTGVTGAGRKASLPLNFAECNESFRAYRVGRHQHTPEIEMEIGGLRGEPVVVLFTPHLAPMNRGILTTSYCPPLGDPSTEELVDLYRSFYERAPFVRVLEAGDLPDTKNVAGLNYCDISLTRDARTGKIIVISAIDNLVKGAAGQAVQNMNILYGLPETMGLI